MSAYVIMDIDIVDPQMYEEYKKLAPAAVAWYGGEYLARGGHAENLEGDWQPGRIVVLEFPNMARAKAWLNSTEYAPAKKLRHQAAKSNAIVVDGVS